MTLKQLADILPGYVLLHIHTKQEGWTMSAGMVAAGEMPAEAYIISANPIAPYTMEVSIKFEEETNEDQPRSNSQA